MLDISEDHKAFVNDAAAEYFSKKRYDSAKVIKTTYDLAILVNPKEESPPLIRQPFKRWLMQQRILAFM